MEEWGISTYGDRIAEIYDRLYGELFDAEATADFLAELAAGGRVLELAIGTGRIAIPLAERGVEVHGIDSSAAMVDKLRAKPGGAGIPVTLGDFAEVPVEGRFRVIFVVFNTLFALTTQEGQVACFANVARRLEAGGAFVVEAFVPDLGRFDRHQRVSATRVDLDSAEIEVSRHDPVAQRVDSNHVIFGSEGTRLFPAVIRYAWPTELDLMARLAGLRLSARYGGWRKEDFTSDSPSHVSIYVKRVGRSGI